MRNEQKQNIIEWLGKDYRMTFMERIHLLLDSETQFEAMPYAIRYGETLHYILQNMSVPIRPNDLLVGAVVEEIPDREEAERITDVYRSWWRLSDEEIQEKILWFYSDGWLKCRPPWFYSFGHLAPDWSGLINDGLDAMREHAVRVRTGLETMPERDDAKIEFTTGAIRCYEAIQRYIERYAQAALYAGRTEQ